MAVVAPPSPEVAPVPKPAPRPLPRPAAGVTLAEVEARIDRLDGRTSELAGARRRIAVQELAEFRKDLKGKRSPEKIAAELESFERATFPDR